MRGKDHQRAVQSRFQGITPAYAGKSLFMVSSSVSAGDHPRLCGEKENGRTRRKNLRGSPPPMRGKVPFAIDSKGVPRITPAYAGKRSQSAMHDCSTTDHPRLCGEKSR